MKAVAVLAIGVAIGIVTSGYITYEYSGYRDASHREWCKKIAHRNVGCPRHKFWYGY